MDKDNYQNQLQDERLQRLENTVNDIKDNHLAHIQTDLTKVGTDVDWLKRFFWIMWLEKSKLSSWFHDLGLY
jgi:uncharacterized protein (UPF0335 family)